RLAVGVVVREVHLEVALAPRADARRVGAHHQAVGGAGRAGRLQLVPALDLDHAEAAGAPGGRARFVAERRDLDALPACNVEDGLAAAGADLPAVDGELHGGLRRPRAHCRLPSADVSMPVSTGIAS